MKLWDILATCLLLLSSVSARPVFHKLQPSKRAVVRSETPALDPIIDSQPETTHQKQASMEEQYDVNGFYPEQFESVMDFIEATIGRLRRSSDADSQTKRDRGRQKGATNTERSSRGRGDRKRKIHLNFTDLGLGYRTKEELIFRYCSGPCFDAETNYDKILNNLTHNKKLDKETPSRTCCRPIAFDDDISFLDDSLEYHTLKKHSAKKCACV
ncbi:hypothetical protein G5714_011372 [Onychostoma macrolepis]|uniref:Glial cell line-derived neurotrophic factor n=1 Tax=Onychostoma macrolepis TaxID=369639 RepID=A0A7J6CQ11_9TELE|nr:hypothetical protein G5714_011372 [Onychostoma macrolepis]